MLLEVPYNNSADNLYGPTGIMDAFRGSAGAVKTTNEGELYPVFFPPALMHKQAGCDPVMINQVAACMAYLGSDA